MRRTLATLLVTAVAVAALVAYRTHPQHRMPAKRAPIHGAASQRRHPPGTRVGTGVAVSSAYTTIQVRAFVDRGRLIDVQEVEVVNDNAHTKALNDGAIPVLHYEALAAGSARIHLVSGGHRH
jgi:uncharacterized protein with FMN-binding domain